MESAFKKNADRPLNLYCLRVVGFSFRRSSTRLAGWVGVTMMFVTMAIGNVALAQEGPGVVVEKRQGKFCFVVQNLANPADGKVNVWRALSSENSSPPMLGSTRIEDGNLVFEPRFSVVQGARYVVEVWPNENAARIRVQRKVPGGEVVPAQVTAIYPSAVELPENMLKFYVQFSAPMQKGEIYRFVRIRETGGKEIELPFLEIEQEFWSRDSKRLTLLLDPGRIKRGLKPREEMGPILVAGKSYELVIDGGWPDAHGNPLGDDFVKRFDAIAEDRSQPDPANWTLSPPKSGTHDPLLIQFPGPLDRAMLVRAIKVVGPAGQSVEGQVEISDHEKRWSLQPSQPWPVGAYRIVVNAELEDNAGNSVGRPFDVDLFDRTEPSDALPDVEVKFEVVR